MAGLFGTIIGGMVLVYFLAVLIEWAAIQRIMDTPKAGVVVSTVIAMVVATTIYGFASAIGTSSTWRPLPGAIGYIIGGSLVLVGRLWGVSRKEQAERNRF